MHPNLRLGENHQPRATLSMTPAPSSSRTSNREPPDPMPPRSTNPAGVLETRAALPADARGGTLLRLDRQRWNSFTPIPSRSQKTSSVNPLCAKRATTSRHACALRRLILCIDRSSDLNWNYLAPSALARKVRRVVTGYITMTRKARRKLPYGHAEPIVLL